MASEQARVVALLDELQAAERAGAAALEQWIRSCREPALRGGLRVVAARDAAHATLAEERLRRLGASPSAEVSRALATLCGLLAAADVSDRSKLAVLLARFPGEVYDPFAEVVRSIEDDGETRALLETIGDAERASLRWLREVGEGLPQVDDDGGAERETVIPLLDALRAAEAAAEEVFGAWIAVCASPGLRGGRRTRVHTRACSPSACASSAPRPPARSRRGCGARRSATSGRAASPTSRRSHACSRATPTTGRPRRRSTRSRARSARISRRASYCGSSRRARWRRSLGCAPTTRRPRGRRGRSLPCVDRATRPRKQRTAATISPATVASVRPLQRGTWKPWSASAMTASVPAAMRATTGSRRCGGPRASRVPCTKSVGTRIAGRCAARSAAGRPAGWSG